MIFTPYPCRLEENVKRSSNLDVLAIDKADSPLFVIASSRLNETVLVMFGPNITGFTGGVVGYWGSSATGSFSSEQNAQADLVVGSTVAYTEITVDASKSSSIYSGSSLQQKALNCLPCIRI